MLAEELFSLRRIEEWYKLSLMAEDLPFRDALLFVYEILVVSVGCLMSLASSSGDDPTCIAWLRLSVHIDQVCMHQYFPSKSSILNPFSILNTCLIGIRFILCLCGILSPQFIC
jgi:hypothetical protein